jgi:alkylation response protein AidB-like acyl-CoA dehydrogenase
MNAPVSLAEFESGVRDWFISTGLPLRTPKETPASWGEGDDGVAVFDTVSGEELRAQIDMVRRYRAAMHKAGYTMLTWLREKGGRELPSAYQQAFDRVAGEYDIPDAGEVAFVTYGLIAPTIAEYGTPEQRQRFVGHLLTMTEVACQLFSEPEAGSDLAAVATSAARVDEGWLLNGQKVWTSGAQVADWGLALTRSDPRASKHAGITAFLVPMRSPGVTVRPIRQMTGGASFSEVFLTDVRIGDECRLGGVGDGWHVALTALSFERDHATAWSPSIGGNFERVRGLAERSGRLDDPLVRHQLADLFVHTQIEHLTNQRVAAARASGRPPGPEASLGKLIWTENMRRIGRVVSELLGDHLVADTGEWGTFAWTQHLLGAPGYRIAGGTDEIQRNIIAERVLGLPRDPRPQSRPAKQSPGVTSSVTDVA